MESSQQKRISGLSDQQNTEVLLNKKKRKDANIEYCKKKQNLVEEQKLLFEEFKKELTDIVKSKPNQPKKYARSKPASQNGTKKNVKEKGKKFQCIYCPYSTARSGNLKAHTRTHTGEKPFKCNECDFACAESNSLKRHKRTHTGERPYKCTFCPAAFASNYGMKRHVRRHTGEKPYKCPHCKYAVVSSSDMDRHIRTHSNVPDLRVSMLTFKW